VSIPHLHALIAYEVIYQAPVSELFAGIYDDIAGRVQTHAEHLAGVLLEVPPSGHIDRKLEALAQISPVNSQSI
jgi:hypothetical protein